MVRVASLLRGIFFLVLMVWAGPWSSAAGAPLRVTHTIDLEKLTENRTPASLALAPDITLTISPSADGMFVEDLSLTQRGASIARFEGGKFVEGAKVEANSTAYWIISEYSGGAHCCGVYHFFAKPGGGKPVDYLGQTRGHNGGPLPLKELLIIKDDKIFFQDMDNRFDYFHESHAGSMLVNTPDTFYEVTPSSIKINNAPFQERYLKDAVRADQEIAEAAAKRTGKPPAILKPVFGPGLDGMLFTDDLGQLLVKRTLYYLYAREDQKGWDTFFRDVKRHYQTLKGAAELKGEILSKLAEFPY